ncbi:hypothetical protein GTR00_01385 [Kineococcus sp. T90]|nr:hypothetical protein [Kineococcus indalonis]
MGTRVALSLPVRAGRTRSTAQKTTVRFIDDLDDSEASGTVMYSLDGVQYELHHREDPPRSRLPQPRQLPHPSPDRRRQHPARAQAATWAEVSHQPLKSKSGRTLGPGTRGCIELGNGDRVYVRHGIAHLVTCWRALVRVTLRMWCIIALAATALAPGGSGERHRQCTPPLLPHVGRISEEEMRNREKKSTNNDWLAHRLA